MPLYPDFDDSEVGAVYISLKAHCKHNKFAKFLVKSITDNNFTKSYSDYELDEQSSNNQLSVAINEILKL